MGAAASKFDVSPYLDYNLVLFHQIFHSMNFNDQVVVPKWSVLECFRLFRVSPVYSSTLCLGSALGGSVPIKYTPV